jgi:hypothetical protein
MLPCGCRWERWDPPRYVEAAGATIGGDVLIECDWHRQAGAARAARFEREMLEGKGLVYRDGKWVRA